MKKVIVDTNVILRFLLKDNVVQHARIEKLLQKAKLGKLQIFIPEIVIFETAFVLRSYYGYKKESISEAIESLVTSDYLIVDNKKAFIETIKLHRLSSVELVDCFLIVKSKQSDIEIFSFDKKLIKLSKTIKLRE